MQSRYKLKSRLNSNPNSDRSLYRSGYNLKPIWIPEMSYLTPGSRYQSGCRSGYNWIPGTWVGPTSRYQVRGLEMDYSLLLSIQNIIFEIISLLKHGSRVQLDLVVECEQHSFKLTYHHFIWDFRVTVREDPWFLYSPPVPWSDQLRPFRCVSSIAIIKHLQDPGGEPAFLQDQEGQSP